MLDVAERRGLDVESLVVESGISPAMLAEGRARVTIEQASEMVLRLWRRTDDELLGLGTQPVPRGTFHMLFFGLLTSPDLATALRRFEKFNRSLPGVPTLVMVHHEGEARLVFDISAVRLPAPSAIDAMLAVTHRFISWAIGRWISLHRVEVPYAAVPGVDDYDFIFGAPMAFEAASPALVFGADVLTAPLARSEDELEAFFRDGPLLVLGRGDYAVSLASQVRRILRGGLDGDWPTVDQVAAQLAMSPQTLRRRLREEGTSAREIREQILRDEAIASLVRGEETIAALARRLGFSEPSAFSRAFSRWTGSAPGSYQP